MENDETITLDIVGTLPPELGQIVLSYLNAKDLAKCSAVCHKWRDLTNCNPIWKRHCIKQTWSKLDMVENYRTHFPIKLTQNEQNKQLSNICSWRLNYERHYNLPINWEKYRTYHYKLTDQSIANCINCNGEKLAIGCLDSTVIILNVNKLPYFEYKFEALLNSKIISVKIYDQYCIVQQSMLLQIFENEYFIDAKSFDLGLSMIEIIQRVNIELEKFNEWYKPGKFKEVFFDVYNFNLYATYRDAQCIYVWSLKNGKRINTIHIKNYLCKMRDMYLNNDKIYIIYAASKSVRHVSVYDINLEKWLYEVTTPLCKTQKILCSDSLLVGIAVAGPALTCTGVINVWQIENGKLVSEKHTQEYLSRTSVTTVYDVIIYTGTTSINIWEPRSDLLIRKITTVGNPVFLKSMPFIFVAVFTDKFAHVYDWYNGIRRFRLFTIFNPDTPEFIYADDTMIILIDECNSVHMIGFC